jgi:hypothetical protein
MSIEFRVRRNAGDCGPSAAPDVASNLDDPLQLSDLRLIRILRMTSDQA